MMASKGYLHKVSEDEIRRWRAISPAMRLDWLEEINEFVWKFAPQKSKKIMEKFKRGEI